jgi:hypothetical protein
MLPKLARLFNRRGHKLEMRGPPAAATADNVSCTRTARRKIKRRVGGSGCAHGLQQRGSDNKCRDRDIYCPLDSLLRAR